MEWMVLVDSPAGDGDSESGLIIAIGDILHERYYTLMVQLLTN